MDKRYVNYMILDTETCTLPLVNEWNLSSKQKKRVAIAKPLVYDIGWTVANRTQGIVWKRNYLVAETFCVPAVFNTAYYAEKRPIYLEMLAKGEIEIKTWNEIVAILEADLENCKYICAFNAMFDFKKAIVFTEKYISELYSPSYHVWEAVQRESCKRIATTKAKGNGNPDFDKDNFLLRGKKYPMLDIWGIACTYLLNNEKYKCYCLENSKVSNTGIYFSTNAEHAMQFLSEQFDFIEDHTALSDAEIETEILFAALRRGKIIQGIEYFPFKMLGETIDFIIKSRKSTREMAENVLARIERYMDGIDTESGYGKQVINKKCRLEIYVSEHWDE